jgi:chorismate mutase
MNHTVEITDNEQIIKVIKDIDKTIMQCLNARNQFMKMIQMNQKAEGKLKRDYKQEQEFISAVSEIEMYPGTAYAIWPAIMEFARESI